VFYTLLALVEPGEEVILPDPGFPAYGSVADFVGARVVPLPLREELEFRFDIDELRAAISPRTKLIILNSPQNPTGSVLEKSDLEAIARLAQEHDLWVLSDEIYRHLTYSGEFHSIASLPGMQERTVILDGFSKSYAMTGWRLGYGIMPGDLAELVTRLAINSHSCVTAFVQRGGVAALHGPQDSVYAMAQAFRTRRDLIAKGLNEIPGWTCLSPRGAFYVFPNIKASGLDSGRMADYLLERAGVAVLPGTAFGAHGEGYLRLSYANSEANLQKALERIYEAVTR
jgi:aspartate/methionine/tyrosine aminotransferase